MFAPRHIWSRGPKRSLAAVALALLVSLTSQPAWASGETYSWASEGAATITAKGGTYGSQTVTFNRTSETNGATYTATADLTCGNPPQTKPGTTLTLTIDAANYKKVNPPRGTVSGADASCDLSAATVSLAGTDPLTGAPSTDKAARCDQGSFSWLLCPVIDNLSGAISNLAKEVLEPMLQVKPITPDSTPELYQTWTHLRDLTEVLFILAFFMTIAGELLRKDLSWFDQYTVKKILPRLVIASVLVQFSFLISSLFVDFGNVLGGGIGNLLVSVTDPSHGPASFSNIIGNLITDSVLAVTGIGVVAVVLLSWTVAMPILISLLLSLLVVLLTLGARYLLIAVLIAASPLAMLAWVLPNTRDFFNDWIKLLMRLIMMYPLVIGIISLAGIVNEILPFTSDTADSAGAHIAVWLVKPLVVIAAFLVIPFTFKLAGKALTRAYSLLNGVSQRGKGVLKGSDMWQEGTRKRQERQASMMKKVLNSSAVTTLQRKGAPGRAAAGMMSAGASMALLRAPGNKRKLDALESKLTAERKKQIEALDESGNPANVYNALTAHEGATVADRAKARAAAMKDAPNLLNYADTPVGRRAMKQLLGERGLLTDKVMTQPLMTDRKASPLNASAPTMTEALRDISAVQRHRKDLPGTVLRMMKDDPAYKVKDGADNVIQTIPRRSGQHDITAAAGVWRAKSSADLQDGSKTSFSTYDIMQQAANAKLSLVEQEYGRDAFKGFILGTQPSNLQKVFNADPRYSESNYAARMKMLQALQANSAVAKDATYKKYYDDAYNNMTSNLSNDKRVTEELVLKVATNAGYDQNEAAQLIKDLGPHGTAAVVRRWTRGEEFTRDNLETRVGDYKTEGRIFNNSRQVSAIQTQERDKVKKADIRKIVKQQEEAYKTYEPNVRAAGADPYENDEPPGSASNPGGGTGA